MADALHRTDIQAVVTVKRLRGKRRVHYECPESEMVRRLKLEEGIILDIWMDPDTRMIKIIMAAKNGRL